MYSQSCKKPSIACELLGFICFGMLFGALIGAPLIAQELLTKCW